MLLISLKSLILRTTGHIWPLKQEHDTAYIQIHKSNTMNFTCEWIQLVFCTTTETLCVLEIFIVIMITMSGENIWICFDSSIWIILVCVPLAVNTTRASAILVMWFPHVNRLGMCIISPTVPIWCIFAPSEFEDPGCENGETLRECYGSGQVLGSTP